MTPSLHAILFIVVFFAAAGFIYFPFYFVELTLIESGRLGMAETPLAFFAFANLLVALIGMGFCVFYVLAIGMLGPFVPFCLVPVSMTGLVLIVREGLKNRANGLQLKRNLNARAARFQMWLQDILIGAGVFGAAMTVACNHFSNDHEQVAITALYEFAALLLSFLIILDVCRFSPRPPSGRRRALAVILCMAVSALPLAVIIPITAWGAWRSALSKIEAKPAQNADGN